MHTIHPTITKSTSSVQRAIDPERSPGEVAQYEPTVDDGRSKEVADNDVKKNAKGVLVRGDGSPLDYDSWESRVARADGMSLETTPLNKMKQAYLSYVKSVQQLAPQECK